MRRIQDATAQWLRAQGGPEHRNWTALAVVLIGAIAHFWLLRDVFGTQPSGIDEDRYIAAFANLAEGLFNGNGPDASTDRQIGTGPWSTITPQPSLIGDTT